MGRASSLPGKFRQQVHFTNLASVDYPTYCKQPPGLPRREGMQFTEWCRCLRQHIVSAAPPRFLGKSRYLTMKG